MSIEQVYKAGEDALQNKWELTFFTDKAFDATELFKKQAHLRTKSLTIPEIVVPTYTVHFNNRSYERAQSKTDFTREISFSLRLDKDYHMYRTLIRWRNLINDFSKNTVAPDEYTSKHRIDIFAKGINTNKTTQSQTKVTITDTTPIQWIFTKCFLKKIGEIPFDYTAGDPLEIEVTVGFLEMNEEIE